MLRLLMAVLVCLSIAPVSHAEPDAERQAQIKELFPKATRIEDRQADIPVYPVYQLQALLGYAYESDTISKLTGFSGQPINLLIGLTPDGAFTGVKVLKHHEPVFLHGLGEAPMFEFVDQYKGHRLNEHIIVNSRKGQAGGESDVVYFDGVTSATVSVIIINDTILSSALKVARQKLEAFAQGPASRPKPDLYRPLNWDQLVEQGYVGHWRISVEDAEAKLGHPLSDYPSVPDPEPGEAFSDLYYGYVTAPMVGRNLLGDAGYAALQTYLKPGDQIMAVMSRGLFKHVADDFKPATVPGRIALEQGGLVVELRDIDRLDSEIRLARDGMPDFERAHLFRVGGHGVFNPAAEAAFILDVEVPKNHLVSDQAVFREPLALPGELFEPVDIVDPLAADTDRAPIWVGLWQDRWLQIAITVLGLTVLTIFFVRQAWFSRYPRLLHRFRWGFLFFTLFFIGFYAQGQLSVVNIYTLFLSIRDGFDINVFLLDPVIFILWVYTFVTLFVWGRGLFCGWLCPFGALQEMASWLAHKLHIRQIHVPEIWHRRLIGLKYVILVGLVAVSFHSLTLAEQLSEVEPFKTGITLFFMRYWPFVLYAVGLLVAGMFIHKFYCRYLCPLGAGLAALGRLRLFSWLERIDLCGSPCQTCKHRCEINAIRTDGRIDYDECIQCLECVVILRDDTQCVDKLIETKRQRKGEILAVNVG